MLVCVVVCCVVLFSCVALLCGCCVCVALHVCVLRCVGVVVLRVVVCFVYFLIYVDYGCIGLFV